MRKTALKLWNNEFVKGGFFITVSTFAGNILNYFFNLIAARALGPSGFGEITAFFSYSLIFSVPIVVITMIIIEKVGSKGEDKYAYAMGLDKWFVTLLKKWWPLIVLSLFISPFVSKLTNLSEVASYALIPSIILTLIGTFYGALTQGLRFFFWFSLIGVVAVFLKLLSAIFVYMGIDGVGTIIIFIFISSIIGLLGYRKIIKESIKEHQNKLKQIVVNKRMVNILLSKQVVITFFSILAITILNNADIIFVKKFFSTYYAGIYAAWSLFGKLILYAIGPAISISYIFFTSAETKTLHEKTLNMSLGVLALIAFFSYVFYAYFPYFLVGIFFGQKFTGVASYLSYASIFGSLYTAITFLNNYFIAKKSSFALILPILIPFYLAFLFFIKRVLSNVMMLNIIFSSLILALYLIAYIRSIFYNNSNGKQD